MNQQKPIPTASSRSSGRPLPAHPDQRIRQTEMPGRMESRWTLPVWLGVVQGLLTCAAWAGVEGKPSDAPPATSVASQQSARGGSQQPLAHRRRHVPGHPGVHGWRRDVSAARKHHGTGGLFDRQRRRSPRTSAWCVRSPRKSRPAVCA